MKPVKSVIVIVIAFNSLFACGIDDATSSGQDAQIQKSQLPDTESNVQQQSTLKAEVQVQLSQRYTLVQEVPGGFIAQSEQNGIVLLDEDQQMRASFAMKTEMLDVRSTETSGKFWVSTLDFNTGDVVLMQVDSITATIQEVLRLPPKLADYVALCLHEFTSNTVKRDLRLYTFDEIGHGEYSRISFDKNKAAVLPIKSFAVGPNIKSCAVDDKKQRLFVVEEGNGVWQYSTKPEAEELRSLITLPKSLSPEFVAVSQTGALTIVSPDFSGVFVRDSSTSSSKTIEIDGIDKPEGIKVFEGNGKGVLNALVFDDENSNVVSVSWDQHDNDVQRSEYAFLNPEASFQAYAQTEPVERFGDAADDPAIWVHPTATEGSLIYATDKKWGLNVYTLKGAKAYSLPVGRINNIDIRGNIAVASNRSDNSIAVFTINPNTGAPSLRNSIPTNLKDVYGICMGMIDNALQVFVNDTEGRYERYDMATQKLVEVWDVPSQPEGCVVDDKGKRLFYGEESAGVWLRDLSSEKPDRLIIQVAEEESKGLTADVEGMGLYSSNGELYLIVSSQGSNSYAVYAVDNDNKLIGMFDIVADLSNNIDGVSETDGLEATDVTLSGNLPKGLLVVQDGRNVMPTAPQNFKLIDGSFLSDFIESHR